jgi:hypothetical protein
VTKLGFSRHMQRVVRSPLELDASLGAFDLWQAERTLVILRIGLILPPGFAVMSFAPLQVFETANLILDKPLYEVHTVSVMGGRIKSSFGMEVETERAADTKFDTLLIASPPNVSPPSAELISFLQSTLANTRSRRVNLYWCVHFGRGGLARRPQGENALAFRERATEPFSKGFR